ncbi:hypothetical protein BDV93DRAFT_193274 [Ceratobasidium sp. AG-I]|nr:hypothetical protein BDV93DRAFT_193274 [Ceratobasidium sp. AG-I]
MGHLSCHPPSSLSSWPGFPWSQPSPLRTSGCVHRCAHLLLPHAVSRCDVALPRHLVSLSCSQTYTLLTFYYPLYTCCRHPTPKISHPSACPRTHYTLLRANPPNFVRHS